MKGPSHVVVGAMLAGIAQAQVVQWDIERRELTANSDPYRLRTRATTLEAAITNRVDRGGYFANCKVGTPAQEVTLQLDTGSSDIWVPDSTATICKSVSSVGCTLGSFSPSNSTTFENVGKNQFSIQYVDGSSSSGDYFTDVFSIAGVSLNNMTMGLGSETDIAYGLVGVGYALSEAIINDTQTLSSVYPNLPVNMVNEGLINTVAYSLWLNDLDASTGNILFGGIDTKKYRGELTRIKVQSNALAADLFTSFSVALTSLTATSSSGIDTLTSSSFPVAVVLDSGTTLSYLPTDLAMQIWNEVGAVYQSIVEDGEKIALIPCSMRNSGGYFSFGFAGPDGPLINVTMDELVLDLTTNDVAIPFFEGIYRGQEACLFGIQNFTAGSGTPFLLGDTFLRSAYVVYDLVNNEIGIAPTDFNATESNIIPFPSANATIPSATEAPSQSAATQKPAVTIPAYAAKAGFAVSTSNALKNQTPQFTLAGVVATLTAMGSALFLMLL